MRWLILTVAAALVALAFTVPAAAREGGGLTLEGFWVAMAGVALLPFGLAGSRAWWRSAALASLFLVGLAAQLALTTPAWLQIVKLRPWELREGLTPLAAVLAASHILVVGLLTARGAGNFG